MVRTLALLAIALCVAGCRHSQIQSRYAVESEACRAMAESRLSGMSSAEIGKRRDAELVTLFSDCMAKRNWQVATPKRQTKPSSRQSEPTKPAETPKQTSTPPPAAQNTQAGSVYDAVPSVGGASGSGYRPVVNESPYETSPLNPNAATYQPTMPVQRTGPVAREFNR